MPDGYRRLRVGVAEVVAREDAAEAVRQAMGDDTLYRWAARHPERRELHGRRPVYAAPLPRLGTRVVVRHAWHGGLLGPVTRDLFLAPRAAHELRVALALARAGVPTPPVVAYALHPAGALRRADVATLEIAGARDGAEALRDTDPARRHAVLAATARLLGRLAAAGARHPDLNLKNLLFTFDAADAPRAWVLDVDRVRLRRDDRGALAANLARLTRSLRKWRARAALPLEESELAFLAREARRLAT